MRRKTIVGWFLLVLWGAASPVAAQRAAEPQTLTDFAQRAGLRDLTGFVETVQSLRTAKRLPPRYVTKGEARAHGWHGGGLCDSWPGHVIGGDTFNNFAGGLPGAPGRGYREAHLDPARQSPRPEPPIFSNDRH